MLRFADRQPRAFCCSPRPLHSHRFSQLGFETGLFSFHRLRLGARPAPTPKVAIDFAVKFNDEHRRLS